MRVIPITTALFRKKENLLSFILRHIPVLHEGDIIVITSKIIALSQNRVENYRNKERCIKKESEKTIATPHGTLTLTKEGWCLNAGIDESNADGQIILLPQKPFETAQHIRNRLKKKYALRRLGVLITDTRSVPLRAGTMGRAIGYTGFQPLKSYVGKKDLFGRKTRRTQSNIADALAASAVLVMGEGDEQIPLAIIRDAQQVEFTNHKTVPRKNRNLTIHPSRDIFANAFTPTPKSPAGKDGYEWQKNTKRKAKKPRV